MALLTQNGYHYLMNLLIGLDQLANALLGGAYLAPRHQPSRRLPPLYRVAGIPGCTR